MIQVCNLHRINHNQHYKESTIKFGMLGFEHNFQGKTKKWIILKTALSTSFCMQYEQNYTDAIIMKRLCVFCHFA